MRNFDKITPDGTRDLMFSDCVLRNETLEKATRLFESRGYRQIMTPAIEFYDVFNSASGHFPQQDMYKLSDTHGRLMVLRPDCTIPIARLTATRLTKMPMPLRIFYSQNVYRVNHDLRGKRNEIFQTGVELIGSGSELRSDLEVAELAVSCLSGIAGDNFRIELCHIGYFKAIIDSLEADADTKERIRSSIEKKNYAALSDLLLPYESSRAAQALKKLPRLFGGEEVFDKAYELFDNEAAKQALDYLRKIYEMLRELDLSGRLLIDLGLVAQAEYYTGLLFRGYFGGIGEPVLSGGRYDGLIDDFGANLSATGFGLDVDLACTAAPHNEPPRTGIMVFAPPQLWARSIAYIRELNANGERVENSAFDTPDEALAFARRCKIAQLHVLHDDGNVQIIETAAQKEDATQ